MAFEAGQLASDYEILGELGKGGMGRVYRVRNVISNRVEAMKVLLADVAAETELSDRFIGEIRTLARLDHPNIAKFHTAFKVENQLVMVMEYVEGFTLADRAKQGPIALNEVLSYVTQTLGALGYAHQNGVVHRDIKPSNIMVTPHGVAKLMDFGIAKSAMDPLVTRPGTTMGSMLYMSPEQVRGTGVDARSDVYSMGVVLYELSSGRRPFESENTFGILEAHLNTAPKPPIELNPALPQGLNEIILTALEKDPMRRFQTAEAFQNALGTLRSGRANQAGEAAATPVPAAVVAASAGKGHRGLWMALGSMVAVVVIAGAVVLGPRFFHSSAAVSAQVVAAPVAAPVSAPVSGPVVTPEANRPAEVTAIPVVEAEKTPVTKKAAAVVTPKLKQDVLTPGVPEVQDTKLQPVPAPVVAPSQPAGPSQQDLDTAEENLMKLHARADAVRSSLGNLKAQQAASGLGLRPDMAAAASRMDSYLGASDRALAGQNLDSAQKNMQRAEDEISKLETFLGR